MSTSYFTSESVTEGHPDKVADAISDAVLDAAIQLNPEARVACETLVTTRRAVVGGEVRIGHDLEIEPIVRETVERIGYDGFDPDFSADSIEVTDLVHSQSSDIAEGVDRELGAGDQGLMFGYANKETDTLMPFPIHMAHRLAERLAEVRKKEMVDYLRPDGKTQVTVRYEGDEPVAVEKILISTHHGPGMGQTEMKEELWALVVAEVVPEEHLPSIDAFIFNPSGRFEIGGPVADAGLTGRKIIVDTYGGYARHGGGAFSGKDSTKVDRSAAYAARWAAKNLVAAGVADRLEIQLSYAIGQVEPFSIYIETFGSEHIDPRVIHKTVDELFDFRPSAIIEALGLRQPVFSPTAAYGHFGRPEFGWEQINRVDDIASAIGV